MLFIMLGLATILLAQQPGVHYWHYGAMPPGAIGTRQLLRGGPLPGYFQPVEIKAPSGALISLAADGQFTEPQSGPCKVGMLIGAVYRLKITGIRLAEGAEVFPTVEIVDRTYPPLGTQWSFPVPVELGYEDLRLALDGKFVTRVIYLEDPCNALPAGENPQAQNWFEVRPGQDPLAVADALGRPVAILRLGGRLPVSGDGPDQNFLFGCPPFICYRADQPNAAQTSAAGKGALRVSPVKYEDQDVKILPVPPKAGAAKASATVSTPPIERIDIDQVPPLPKAAYPPWGPPGIRQPWPEDEYLRDGGDAGVPAAVAAQCEVRGLEMEDAIAHYDTLDGRTLVTPSNEVYIYSPRFAAVRQVVGLVANEQKQRLSDVHLNTALATPTATQKIGAAKQQLQLVSEIGARPAQAFIMKQGDGAMSSVIGPRGFQNAYMPYENIAVIRRGIFENTDKALLIRGAQAAVTWSHTQAVQIILDRKAAMVAVENEQAEAVYVASVPPGNPKLRIIKLASTPYALPGEEVWFTLRFDNIGNQTIGNVTIIDSLSTRLEYVDQSAQCSRTATFSTRPNEGGSLVIRCELAEPLEVGRGGIVRFCCKVRWRHFVCHCLLASSARKSAVFSRSHGPPWERTCPASCHDCISQ